MTVTTKYFSIAPGRYVRQAAKIWAAKWWWATALPVCLLLLWGTHDIRISIAALGTVLIIYPMIMAYIYFSYALRPEAALAVLNHRATVSVAGVDIEYLNEEGHPNPAPRRIPASDIKEVEDAGEALIIHLKSGRYDFIELPADSFEEDEMAKALAMLRIK